MLRKLLIAWHFIGMRDYPDSSFRIGLRRAWCIANIITDPKHRRALEILTSADGE